MPRTSEADLEEHVLSLLAAEGYEMNAGSLFDPDSGGGPGARVQKTPPLACTARSNYQEWTRIKVNERSFTGECANLFK